MKKLPENPFKETDKLTEKLTLDIANKTDKALVESLNDLIKAGILEIKVLQPHTEFHENCLTVKSGVQVVPKFDEYTKKLEEDLNKSIQENNDLTKSFLKLDDYSEELEDSVIKLRSENSELKKQLSIVDFDYSYKLEKEIERLKDCLFKLRLDLSDEIYKHTKLQDEYEKLKSKYDSLTENLTAAMEAADFLKKFLKLEK